MPIRTTTEKPCVCESTYKVTAVKNGFNDSCHESSTVEAGLPTCSEKKLSAKGLS